MSQSLIHDQCQQECTRSSEAKLNNDHTVFESLFVSSDCRHSLLTQVTGNDDMYMVHMATAQGQRGSLVIVNITD